MQMAEPAPRQGEEHSGWARLLAKRTVLQSGAPQQAAMSNPKGMEPTVVRAKQHVIWQSLSPPETPPSCTRTHGRRCGLMLRWCTKCVGLALQTYLCMTAGPHEGMHQYALLSPHLFWRAPATSAESLKHRSKMCCHSKFRPLQSNPPPPLRR